MQRIIKKRSHKAGLPPGSLVHIGEKKSTHTKFFLYDFDEKQLVEKEILKPEEVIKYKKSPSITWIHAEGLYDVDALAKLGKSMGLHQLIVEDILNTDQRPKVEIFENYIYIVLKALEFNQNDQVSSDQISIILGKNFVVSVVEQKTNLFDPLLQRLRNPLSRVRKSGADYLAYSIIDSIVDYYFVVLEKCEERIEALEEELTNNPTQKTMQTINNIKHLMIFLRKSIWPIRELLSSLQRSDSRILKESTQIYIRDVYDHIIQIIDAIESYRDILGGMLEVYLSIISNRLNEIMKVLTIIATIFIPLTFIVGIYGMNFEYMPELKWKAGYPLIMLFMAIVAFLMLRYFRKKKWV
ncbi:MAG: magnesium/cobalt transporter CorA [Candidatus Woesearchaeota archaeon]